jgi:DNA-directed RNA polymerase specialized sigma24 family protein
MVDMSPAPASPAPPTADPFTVEAIMARLAAGDTAAIFALAEHHGHRIAGVVRRQLRTCGVESVAPDDLQSLVLDACMALHGVARAWRPGGALPWWWAEGRIRGVVNRWVGIHTDPLDDHWSRADRELEPAAPSAEEGLAEAFARLVAEDPRVHLVAAPARAAKVDDVALVCLLDYQIQQVQGDPSPAHTLAERYGTTPDAMRQRICRGRRRLRQVVANDPRFAVLSELELVA